MVGGGFRRPREYRDPNGSAFGTGVSADPMTKPTLVCVVDDDQSIRRSLDNLLASVGIEVQTFASAEDYLRSEALDTTACLILDFVLAGMNGLELMQHLKTLEKPVPVVMLTAHDDADVRRQAMSLGARAFLTKPLDANQLMCIVHKLV